MYAITFSSRALLQSSITVISTYQFCFFRHFHWWHSCSHDAKLYPDYTYECIFMEIFCSLFLPGVIPGPGKIFFRLALSLASTFSSICYTSRSNSFFRLCFIRFRVHVKKEGRKKWKRIRMYHDKFKYALYFRLKEPIGLIVSG